MIEMGFARMLEEHMWTLSDGTVVEKKLIEYCLASSTPPDSLAYHMIVDPTDPNIERLFTTPQLAEIVAAELAFPVKEFNEEIIGIFDRLEAVETDEQVVNYIRNLKYGTSDVADWLVAFLPSWRRFYTKTRLRPCFENCYGDQIWSPLFGLCVDSIPSLSTARGELSSHSSRIRENNSLTSGLGVRCGPKYDMLIRSMTSTMEYGGAEFGRVFESVHRPKWKGDRRKLAVLLRDMLVNINNQARRGVVRRVSVVGLIAAGLTFQFMRMGNPKGYVTVLHTEAVMTVPTDPRRSKELCAVLRMVLHMKHVMQETSELVESAVQADSDHLDIPWLQDPLTLVRTDVAARAKVKREGPRKRKRRGK